jgi:hypothetical protein
VSYIGEGILVLKFLDGLNLRLEELGMFLGPGQSCGMLAHSEKVARRQGLLRGVEILSM